MGETVWISAGNAERYHTDPDCAELDSRPHRRPVEIGKAWYVPCEQCAGTSARSPGGDQSHSSVGQ